MSVLDEGVVLRLDGAEPTAPPELEVVAPLGLKQLRADWPGWAFEHRENRRLAWVATRQYRVGWRGGHPVCEAETPEILQTLLRSAVETDAKVAALTERPR